MLPGLLLPHPIVSVCSYYLADNRSAAFIDIRLISASIEAVYRKDTKKS
jgi:hypothetical protein